MTLDQKVTLRKHSDTEIRIDLPTAGTSIKIEAQMLLDFARARFPDIPANSFRRTHQGRRIIAQSNMALWVLVTAAGIHQLASQPVRSFWFAFSIVMLPVMVAKLVFWVAASNDRAHKLMEMAVAS